MAEREKKILRLRIHQDGRVREHLVPRGKRFTYGRSSSNDVILLAAGVPARATLVEGGRHQYRLLIPRGARGEVRAGNSVLQIQDLIQHGLLRRKDAGYVLPVWVGKSGKLEVNGVLIEYDFVLPPRELNRLPDYSWKRALLRAVVSEPLLKLLFIFLLVGNLVAVNKVKQLSFPERQTIALDKVPQRFAKFIPRAMRKEQPPPTAAVGKGAATGEEKSGRKEQSREKTQRSQQASRGGGAQAVVRKGILGLIGGVGESASSSSVVDFLVDKGLVKELDQVLAETGDLQMGRAGSGSEEQGSLDDLFAMADLANVNVDEVADQAASGIGDVELKKEGLVELDRVSDVVGSEEALGQRSEEQLRAVILANRGRIEYIYNKYLRRNPNLSGKIVVEITIEPDGTVSKVRAVESTIDDLSFINDILSAVRRWRFPSITEGVVIVTYPMIFYRAQ